MQVTTPLLDEVALDDELLAVVLPLVVDESAVEPVDAASDELADAPPMPVALDALVEAGELPPAPP